MSHLSAVPNRIKILEISPHSQTEFALESARLTWQMGWETIKMNSENNKEVFSLLFPPLLEKKTKIHKHLLYRQEGLMGLTEEERKAC